MQEVNQQGFSRTLLEQFGREPTGDQTVLLHGLVEFVFTQRDHHLFLLRGYAGTGKTTVLGAFVKTLRLAKRKVRLLAPTGRAAKVLGQKSAMTAFTIHKLIYRRALTTDGSYKISIIPNLHKNTVFIVDEASMIGDYTLQKDGSVSSQNLLEDLMEYVFSGVGCKLIFLGDDGQLPPVGADFSPALNKEYLEQNFPKLTIDSVKLNEVVRQTHDSSILLNATNLRSAEEFSFPRFTLEKKGDLQRLPGEETQETLEHSFGEVGVEDTIVITRSNKRANAYNNHIRSRVFWYEEDLCSGDLVMAVKNNYHWLGEDSSMGFIANGEMMRINRIVRREELYGFQFARVLVSFVDYPTEEEKELIVLMNCLQLEGPSMGRNEMKQLFFEIEKDYADEKNKRKRYDKILKNPYFNALQIKYAYAVTCHKSQGGQWAHVYVDQGYITEEMLDASYFRWLYTALTRATERVYLMNFKSEFFD